MKLTQQSCCGVYMFNISLKSGVLCLVQANECYSSESFTDLSSVCAPDLTFQLHTSLLRQCQH